MPQLNPDLWPMMQTYLKSRELDFECAKANLWYPSSTAGDGVNRIVMPATNLRGCAYWQARAMGKEEPRYQSPSVPRSDSVIQVYPLNTDWLPMLIISEGPMDALAAATHGIRAIALMGLSPTDDTLATVKTFMEDVKHTMFFADRDALPETVELLRRCLKLNIHFTISSPEPYKDLAAIPKSKRNSILQMFLAMCPK